MRRAVNGQGTVRYQSSRKLYEARLMIDGNPQSAYTKTEAEAIAKLSDLRVFQAHRLDMSSTACRWRVGCWLEHGYTNVIAPGATPTTLDGYSIGSTNHITPLLGRVRLGKLATERVEWWQREPEADHPRREDAPFYHAAVANCPASGAGTRAHASIPTPLTSSDYSRQCVENGLSHF
jgi:hypothetical protein